QPVAAAGSTIGGTREYCRRRSPIAKVHRPLCTVDAACLGVGRARWRARTLLQLWMIRNLRQCTATALAPIATRYPVRHAQRLPAAPPTLRDHARNGGSLRHGSSEPPHIGRPSTTAPPPARSALRR